MIKKEPQIIHEDNLKSALAFRDLGIDFESDEYREMTIKLKKFYFGDIEESAKPMMTYFMVK